MKRTLSILLAALLVLGLFGIASAEGEKRVIVVDGGGDQQDALAPGAHHHRGHVLLHRSH